MNDENLKKAWNALSSEANIPDPDYPTPEQFVRSKPASIQDKIRNILTYDLILKGAAGIVLILDAVFYFNRSEELTVILTGILLFGIMVYLEIGLHKQFEKISDPGQATRENLSAIMVFLRRKSFLYSVIVSSSNLLIFVFGLMLYFHLAYGYFKPLTLERFSVFSILCGIGVVTQFLRTRSQIGFHISHLSVFLSDINNNALVYVSESIEKQRKQDMAIRGLVGMLLIIGFVLMIAILKSIGH